MADETQMEEEYTIKQEDGEESEEPMETEERTENYDKYLGMGFPGKVAGELDKFLVKKILAEDELDERALDALKELDESSAVGVLKQFSDSDLSHVNNKSAFLCGVIKAYRQKSRMSKAGAAAVVEAKGPDEAKIKEILDRTGYSLDVTTGQRKYGGPPPEWEGEPPLMGTEVFVGKIPKDLFEDALIPLFEKCGTIYDLRLMMDPLTGMNRGYAFVTYIDKVGANEAVKQLNGYKIKEGWQINCNVSIPKSRLYIGSIPKTKSKEEIKEEFDKHTSGLVDVIIYHSEDKKKNRGFAFLEYDSHKSASLARRKMMSGRIKIWNNIAVNVDWADPIVEPDGDTMSKVKVVYIRNLTVEATEEKIKTHFEQWGKVERVKKMKDYCFVHFEEREHAIKAIEDTHEKEYEGSNIEVSLAKPPQENKEKKKRQMRGGFGGGFGFDEGFGHRGGMMPPRGRGRGFGGGDRFRGGYGGGFGGMDNYYGGYEGGYGGGYDGGYDGYDRGFDYGYGGGYRGGRGGPRGRGPYGGGPMRGGPRGRGGMGGRGAGRGGPRGGRGGPRGGRGGRGGNIGGKRKFEGAQQMDTKRRNTQGGQWGAQPIAQQPLDQQSYGYDYNGGYGKDSWSSDNYGAGWQ